MQTRVARFSLEELSKITLKYTKLPQNIPVPSIKPNDHKIFQSTIK
jgi:hypothetical protein